VADLIRPPRRRLTALVAVLVLLVTACAPRGPDRDREAEGQPRPGAVTVASFNFSESVLLAELYAQALEGAGIRVRREMQIGSREDVEPALEQGLVDVVPEYLGTAVAFLDPSSVGEVLDADAAHQRLSQLFAARGVRVLRHAPAENQNGFVVTPATAQRYGLRAVSDLAPVAPNLAFGGPPECPERPFCLLGLQKTYGLRFRTFLSLDSGGRQTRTALEEGEVDVGLLFTTDGHLARGDFVLLDDDRGLQPPENVVPVVRQEVVDRFGARLVERLEAVSAQLTTAELSGLNRRVDIDGMAPGTVAADWLRAHGLTTSPAGG
jgi:osmoprotectant transport system substrate-binding protein